MEKLVLPGFEEKELLSRIVHSEEAVREFFCLEGFDCQVFSFGYEPGHTAEPHTHEEIRLTFVRTGTMKFTLDTIIRDVKAGDFIIIKPNVTHGFEASQSSVLNIVELVLTPSPENRRSVK